MTDDIEPIENHGWEIRPNRTGRSTGFTDKLIQLQKGDRLAEYHVTPNDFERLMEDFRARREDRLSKWTPSLAD